MSVSPSFGFFEDSDYALRKRRGRIHVHCTTHVHILMTEIHLKTVADKPMIKVARGPLIACIAAYTA